MTQNNGMVGSFLLGSFLFGDRNVIIIDIDYISPYDKDKLLAICKSDIQHIEIYDSWMYISTNHKLFNAFYMYGLGYADMSIVEYLNSLGIEI